MTDTTLTPDGEQAPAGPVLDVTPAALTVVLGIRADEADADRLGLRVAVSGARGTEYLYELGFEPIEEFLEGHVHHEIARPTEGEWADAAPLVVMVPEVDAEKLRGAELDVPRTAGQGGLVIRNPNRPDPLAGIDLRLEGDLPEKVTQLLTGAINPMLASHGGFAELVGVDEQANVYITMGGGCQGCAMSRATLTEGISAQIKEALPEVADVIDATDHTAGQNPFYT